jgi:hypothetical protein
MLEDLHFSGDQGNVASASYRSNRIRYPSLLTILEALFVTQSSSEVDGTYV